MALEYPSRTDWKWHGSLSADANDYSSPLIIPGFVDDIVAQVEPGSGGTVLLQYTAAEPEDVDADPGAVTWIDWAAGAVSVNTAQTALGAIGAIRIYAAGQPATAKIIGEKRVDWR